MPINDKKRRFLPGRVFISHFFFVLLTFSSLLLQSAVTPIILNQGFRISLLYAFLLLGIFYLPAMLACLSIIVFAIVTDLISSQVNGIYLASYFFSLLPVFFIVYKIKKELFFPIFIIFFMVCFFMKTLIEIFLGILFYDLDTMFMHLRNNVALETVLSTLAAMPIYMLGKLIYYKTAHLR